MLRLYFGGGIDIRDERIGVSFMDRALTLLWGLCCSALMLLIMFFNHANYASKGDFYNQWALIFSGLLLIILIYLLLRRIGPAFPVRSFVLVSGLLFLGLQICMVMAYWFQTGWDSGAIIYLAKELALGLPLEAYPISRYPNNSLITVFYCQFYELALKYGLGEWTAYKYILAFQCFLSFATAQLTFYGAKMITEDNRLALLAYAVFQLLIGLSPWVSIPYSDALTLPFPILILVLYLWHRRRSCLPLFALMGFIAYMGYNIKPTVMIVFIAICIYELLDLLRCKKLLPTLGLVLSCALGLALGMLTYSGIISSSGIVIDEEQTYGASHFLNMALNEETMGVYSEDDVHFSESFATAEERSKANLESAKARLEDMGLSGLILHLSRKMLSTYNDGTFSWAREGFFVVRIPEPPDQIFSPLIRSIYHGNGRFNRLFLNFEHALWLAVFLLSGFAAMSGKGRKFSVPALALLGLVLYFMLFESRGRYVYIYAPIYILMAVLGLQALSTRLQKSQ